VFSYLPNKLKNKVDRPVKSSKSTKSVLINLKITMYNKTARNGSVGDKQDDFEQFRESIPSGGQRNFAIHGNQYWTQAICMR
jgi:hypothetical protein